MCVGKFGREVVGTIITSKNYKYSVGSMIEGTGKGNGYLLTLVRRNFGELKG
jgi:hypothetical protein